MLEKMRGKLNRAVTKMVSDGKYRSNVYAFCLLKIDVKKSLVTCYSCRFLLTVFVKCDKLMLQRKFNINLQKYTSVEVYLFSRYIKLLRFIK